MLGGGPGRIRTGDPCRGKGTYPLARHGGKAEYGRLSAVCSTMLSYRPTHEWARTIEVRLKTCSDRYSLFVKIAYSSRTTDLETAISGCTTSVRTMCWAGSSAWYARQRPKNVRFARYSARGTGRSRVRIPPGPPSKRKPPSQPSERRDALHSLL